MEIEDVDLSYDNVAWEEVNKFFENKFNKIPDLTTMLFVIGHRELGLNIVEFSKEQKEELIHVAVCSLLSKANYYTFIKLDEDGWPHYEYNREMPKLNHEQQESLLKKMIIEYIKNL